MERKGRNDHLVRQTSKDNTWLVGNMKFLFECSTRYLTRLHRLEQKKGKILLGSKN